MINNKDSVWLNPLSRRFVGALTGIDDAATMKNFIRDLMTESEILEISSRLEAARMLKYGEKYTDIIKRTKLSSRTIARISEWMKKGCGGYAAVLEKAEHTDHTKPASAV